MNMHIQSTDRTPEIIFTSAPLHLSIKGESYPEDVAAFYGNVIQTMSELPRSASQDLTAELSMVYINSSSIKAFYRIFENLDLYRQAGHQVQVTWKTPEDDDIMQELGEDFKDRFPELNFTIEQHG